MYDLSLYSWFIDYIEFESKFKFRVYDSLMLTVGSRNMTSSSEFVESAEDFYRYLESESVEVLPSDLSFLDF